MADTHFRVQSVGPLVSFQDAGRSGMMRYGVPNSGPMDRFSHRCASTALGISHSMTAIEISMAGLSLECVSGEVTMALTGAQCRLSIDDRKFPGWSVVTIRAGETLTVRAGEWGSFAYLTFAGELQCHTWLGSSATYAQSNLGGGLLTTDQEIVVEQSRVVRDREGPLTVPEFVSPSSQVRVVPGPQQRHFSDDAVAVFSTATYRLSNAYDRMGVRLDGDRLTLNDALSIPSEPVLRGSVQVSGEGVPTVLLADHQTTGGYPKIATLVSADLDRFTQNRAGDSIRFKLVSSEDAIGMARELAVLQSAYLEYLITPRGSLDYRLMHENLIDGVVSAV